MSKKLYRRQSATSATGTPLASILVVRVQFSGGCGQAVVVFASPMNAKADVRNPQLMRCWACAVDMQLPDASRRGSRVKVAGSTPSARFWGKQNLSGTFLSCLPCYRQAYLCTYCIGTVGVSLDTRIPLLKGKFSACITQSPVTVPWQSPIEG